MLFVQTHEYIIMGPSWCHITYSLKYWWVVLSRTTLILAEFSCSTSPMYVAHYNLVSLLWLINKLSRNTLSCLTTKIVHCKNYCLVDWVLYHLEFCILCFPLGYLQSLLWWYHSQDLMYLLWNSLSTCAITSFIC